MYYRQRKKGLVQEETRVLLRVLTRKVKREIGRYKTEKWQSFLSTVQDSHDRPEKAFWNYLSRVYKPKTLPFSKLAVNGKSLSDEQVITDELYKYYEEQFQPPSIDKNDPHDAEIEKEYIEMKRVLEASNEPVRATSTFEITKYIKKLKGKKSTGYDSVSNYMLKLLPPGYVGCLTKCFNKWLTECSYPEPWKTAKIITLSKLKSSTLGESQQLLPIEQSGFRPGCLLPTRVLSIYQEVKNNLAGNIPTLAIYYDYQKAYDKVWHIGLSVKLYRLGMPHGLLKMIVSWLSGRKAYINF
ncbi:unnamed protein product, partial [Didymodactylos carnosus]